MISSKFDLPEDEVIRMNSMQIDNVNLGEPFDAIRINNNPVQIQGNPAHSQTAKLQSDMFKSENGSSLAISTALNEQVTQG